MEVRNTITLELPEALTSQLNEQQVSEQELQAVLTAMIETWLAQRAGRQELASKAGRFSESAIPFAKQLVAQNRALFEELAKL
ncbi:MAG: hypothetical protein ACETWR_11350 [Anaerolineae bacterium]